MSTVGARWYTIAEAAPILGVSVDTIRRRVKRGQLEARQVRTQHGPTWEVCLGDRQGEPAPAAEGTEGVAQGDAYGGVGGAEDRSQALSTWVTAVLAPLAAELGEARQTIERQAERLEHQAETIGRQGAELERAQAERDAAEVSRRRDTRRLSIALAVLALLTIAAMLPPAWVR